MPRLRKVSPSEVGWTRRAVGRGFSYLDATGERLSPADVARCKALVIPPAWKQVWICPHPTGHLQATGIDAAGRKQYLYHPQWRVKRDTEKHRRVLDVACRLPDARERVSKDLDLPDLPRDRALAAAFRLLDLGFFRVGNETYAEENGSYGLTTLLKEHLTVHDDSLEFDFIAKSGKQQHVVIVDEQAHRAIVPMKRRRSAGQELLAYRERGHWVDVTSDDVNAYVHEVIGGEMSAKDFRTWHATVLAAVALAGSVDKATSRTARKRAVSQAMKEVSAYLGNTPTVARASYVDPRVVDLYENGDTIAADLSRLGDDPDPADPQTHREIESAVLRLLD